MSDGGKGDKRRRSEVSQEVIDQNWDRIFGKRDQEILVDSVAIDSDEGSGYASPQLLVETPN